MAAAIAGGHHGGQIVQADPLQGGQRLFRPLPGLGAGTHDGAGTEAALQVQDRQVGGGGAAVDARHIAAPLPGGMHRRGAPQVQLFRKGLQTGGELSVPLWGEVGLQLEQGKGRPAAQGLVLKGVIVAEFDGMIKDPPQARLLQQFAPAADLVHAHTGQLSQQSPGIPVQQPRTLQPFGRRGKAAVPAAGQVGHRKGRAAPQRLQQAGPGPGPGHRQKIPLRQRGGGRKGGAERGGIEPGPPVGGVGRRQALQPVLQQGPGAAVCVMGQIQQIEKVQLPRRLQYVVYPADAVAAVDQHQLPEARPAALLQHRLGVTAELVVGHALGVWKATGLLIQQHGMAAQSLQQLQGRVFTGVSKRFHALPSNCSKKAWSRVTIWPSLALPASQPSPSSTRVGKPAASSVCRAS